MDLSQFRPLHGWRVFAGEVGVIVLGVLLALGAQQLAEKIQISCSCCIRAQLPDSSS
jgi:hypothetical protein